MLSLLLLSLVASSQAQGPGHEEIMKNIQKWNDDVACWGRENMLMFHVGLMKASEQCGGYGLASGMLKPANPFAAIQSPFNTLPSPSNNPFTTLPGNAGNPWVNTPQPVDRNPLAGLVNRGSIGSSAQQWSNLWSNYLGGRTKRQAEPLLEVDEEEAMQKFLDDYEDFKEDWGAKMGNLTCVLTKMNMLDSSLQVNMQLFTRDIWTMTDMSKTLAGQDPEWVQKVTQGYTDCYQIASNWPQQSLDRNPLSRVFGRHMIFFKCSMVSNSL